MKPSDIVTKEDNRCIHRHNGLCVRCGEKCPSEICYDKNDNNNLPCEGVVYEE